MTHHLGITVLALALCLTPLATGTTQAAAQDDPIVLSGTVTKLDLDRLRGLLTTDLGMRIFFEVPNAFLFENVTVGARITLQLDDSGQAVKVMDTSLPDLLAIPTASTPHAKSAEPLTTNLDAQMNKVLERR